MAVQAGNCAGARSAESAGILWHRRVVEARPVFILTLWAGEVLGTVALVGCDTYAVVLTLRQANCCESQK